MSPLVHEVSGVLGTGVLGALFLTARVERDGVEHFERFRRAGSPVIFVFWHGHLLPLVHVHRGEGIVVLVSEHGDGEHIAAALARNGFGTVRGSSTRGGVKGLKGLVRAARAGRDLAITPDGPRGPRGVFKAGALAAARLTGLPVIPLAVGASAGWRLGSWDGFLVPKPFSTVRITYLPPRWVPRDASRRDLEALAAHIGGDLDAAAERLVAAPAGRAAAAP